MKVQINQLKFGHDKSAPLGGLNVRQHERKVDLAGLAASIRAHGLLSPLIVVADATASAKKPMWHVADGNRRFAAIGLLVKEGLLQATDEVPVKIVTVEEAREFGLAANVLRAPLHPADQYQAIVSLAKGGLATDEIAIRFGAPVKNVRQMLALGDLSPRVLDAWRGDKFGANATKIVAEFTMARDQAEQEAVLAKVDFRYLYEGSVRRALGADNYATRALFLYVGREAYLAAGGTLVEDLFGDATRIVDIDVCERLAAEKIGEACKALIAEGWSWAKYIADLPMEARWHWRRIAEGTDADKASTGCVLSISQQGEVEVRDFVVMPEGASVDDAEDEGDQSGDNEAKEPLAAPEVPKPTISKVMTSNLASMSAAALQRALPSSPKSGLAALLAGLVCSASSSYGASIKVRFDGGSAGDVNVALPAGRFHELLATFADMSVDQLLEISAVVAARGVDLSHQPLACAEGSRALADVLDPDVLGDALREGFDASTYFAGIKKALVVEAIEESMGEDHARRVKTQSKGEIVAFAVANVPSTGWLPPELRHPAYDGPGAEVVEEDRQQAA